MATVEEIQSEVESLPRREYIRLLRWIHKEDWEDWGKELEEDALSGRLDFLILGAELRSRRLRVAHQIEGLVGRTGLS